MPATLRAILAIALLATPTASFAGWGAIACDVDGSGACSSSWNWSSRGAAEAKAMTLCSNRGYRCYVDRWEHNQCTYGPRGSWACN